MSSDAKADLIVALRKAIAAKDADIARLRGALRNVRGSLTLDAAWVFAEAGLFSEEELDRANDKHKSVK